MEFDNYYISGFIPEKLTFCVSNAINTSYPKHQNKKSFTASVTKVVESQNKAVISTAKRNLKTQNTFEIDNKEFNNVKIIKKTKDGFNVLLEDKYIIEILNDCIEDILSNSKINDGIIEEPLIFGKLDRNISLMRKDSLIYKTLFSNKTRSKLKNIKEKDFALGTIYQTLSKLKYLYLGEFNTVEYSSTNLNERHNRNYVPSCNFLKEKFKRKVFLSLGYVNSFNDIDNVIKNGLCSEVLYYSKNIKLIEKVGEYKIPEDISKEIRKTAKDKILSYINLKNQIEYYVTYYSFQVNLHRKDEEIQEFDIKKFLAFT